MTTDVKSQKSRKVAVLGPIPHDQIVTDDGERFEKYGCVLYTAVALSALLDAGDTIAPISHVHRKDEGPIKEILAPFPNIDTSGITSSADRGDRVELRYFGLNRRAEWQASFMDPILPGDVAGVGDRAALQGEAAAADAGVQAVAQLFQRGDLRVQAGAPGAGDTPSRVSRHI